ncbi:MAG: hypothetical protein IPM52_01635 [Bacteroidetes bacterium]|nr:hypothetical protein [Bacteroidota bacterium]
MKRILITIFIVLPAIAVLHSCGTEDLRPAQVFEIDPVFREYAAFDSTSYWIYVKTTTDASVGRFDTVRVLRTYKDKRFHSDATTPQGFYYQAIESVLHSKFTGMSKFELTVGKIFGQSSASDNLRVYFNNGRYYRVLITNTPFGEELLLGINEGNYTTIEKIPSLDIQGKTYSEVYHTKVVDYQNAPDTAYFDFWIARNYGIVRYKLYRPKSEPVVIDNWELLDSYVVPYTR